MKTNELIRKRRKELGLTQKQVAKACGCAEGTVSRWESCEIKDMKRKYISSLAKILDISPSLIVGHLDEEEEEKDNIQYLLESKPKLMELLDKACLLNDKDLEQLIKIADTFEVE